jgi:hypothetical protein
MRVVTTAGERVAVDSEIPRLMELLMAATGGELCEAAADDATVRLKVEAQRQPFQHDGWMLVARGVWAAPPRTLLLDACSSGFDLLVEPRGPTLHVSARYRPAPRTRAANTALGERFRLLAGQTLLHYPALWWASLRGRVPLHVSVTRGAGGVTMLAGPAGVGKSTLLAAGLPRGEIATADNVCACDAYRAYGLVEPLRVDTLARDTANVAGAAGPGGPARAPHGRREYRLPGRAAWLDPQRLVVLRRGAAGADLSLTPVSSAQAAHELVAGTYMAGELRRFWQFAATLALATGLGPAHPDVSGVASALADRLPCLELRLGDRPAVPIDDLLALAGAA